MSFNQLILMGNLTRDPELRHLDKNNTKVCTVGLAVNRRYKTAFGEEKEDVLFLDCEAFGKTAETIERYLSKGKQILLKGRLTIDQWTDKDGNPRSKPKMIVESLHFTGSRGDGEARAEKPARTNTGSKPKSGQMPVAYEPIGEDDIPF